MAKIQFHDRIQKARKSPDMTPQVLQPFEARGRFPMALGKLPLFWGVVLSIHAGRIVRGSSGNTVWPCVPDKD